MLCSSFGSNRCCCGGQTLTPNPTRMSCSNTAGGPPLILHRTWLTSTPKDLTFIALSPQLFRLVQLDLHYKEKCCEGLTEEQLWCFFISTDQSSSGRHSVFWPARHRDGPSCSQHHGKMTVTQPQKENQISTHTYHWFITYLWYLDKSVTITVFWLRRGNQCLWGKTRCYEDQ